MGIDGYRLSLHFDDSTGLDHLQCYGHPDDDTLASAASIARQQQYPQVQLLFARVHKSTSQQPITVLINQIPDSQPSVPSCPRQTIRVGLTWLFKRLLSEMRWSRYCSVAMKMAKSMSSFSDAQMSMVQGRHTTSMPLKAGMSIEP